LGIVNCDTGTVDTQVSKKGLMMSELVAIASSSNAARDYKLIEVTPYAGSLGAEISGVAVDKMEDAAFAEIKQASLDHQVVFIQDQNLEVDGFESFVARWGSYGEERYLGGMDDHPHVVALLKEADEKVPIVFGGAWHSDWSFMETPPAYTFLYALDIPDYGGDTLFANMYLVYDFLSPEMQRICDGLTVIHSAERGYGPNAKHNDYFENMDIKYDESALATQEHPLVRVHPETGRKAIFANPVYAIGIKGMKSGESSVILNYLYSIAQNHAFICRYRWNKGSIAIWDNRCAWHFPISDYHGQRREMWRMTVAGDKPSGPANS
jgi:taurine dioxygenase